MSKVLEKTHEKSPFLERYFSTHHKHEISRNIGRVSTAEVIGLDKRFDVEIASGFSEALNGRVHTEYNFGVEDLKIVADDGESFEAMMRRARRDAYQLKAIDPEMGFVSERFELELEELYDQQAMANGRVAHNTIITFSPMTFEKADKPNKLKKGYQRPDLIRSMVRLSYWDGQKLLILTRSLDHSSLSLLKHAARKGIGYEFKASGSLEMLGERIHMAGSLDEARKILDDICSAFDQELEILTGKQSNQGAFAPENIDLIAFVESHPKILLNVKKEALEFAAQCETYEEFEVRLNSCLYRHLALYDELLNGTNDLLGSIAVLADGAGSRAAENGTEYSLCGFVITSGLVDSIGSETGYGSLTAFAFQSQRKEIVDKLLKEKRKGECVACGAEGSVFGCGLCARCNKVWCDEFKLTGKGLGIDTIAKRFAVDRKKNIDQKRIRLQAESVRNERGAKRFWN